MTAPDAMPGSAPPPDAGALARLDGLRGAGALRAALLALLLAPDQPARVRLWREETSLTADSETIRSDVEALDPALRVPLYERLLARAADAPLGERQKLLRAARRVLSAPVVPMDRLLWLAMRRAFGERPPARDGGEAASAAGTPSRLPMAELLPIVHVTAHLARIVPGGAEAGQAWYRRVLAEWFRGSEIPAWQRPDIDVLVGAFAALQATSWVLRPQVVRRWVVGAMGEGQPPLGRDAADALRLACGLLDCPLPPELARAFGELPPAA